MKSIFSRKKLFAYRNSQGARFLFFGIIACFFFLQLPLHAFAIDGYTPDQIQQANGGAPAGSGISEFVHNIAQYYGWENTPEESEADYTVNKGAQGAAHYAQQAQTQAAAGNVAGAQAAAAKATADANIAHNAANNAQAAQALNSCSFAGGNLLDCTISILAQVAYFLMTAAGFLLGLVGIIFNWVVVITVFQFGTYFGNTTGMLAAWAILRDIGNIALLFSFISIGVMMILDVHGVDAKKALPRLIIFAILLKFSLFISEAVVDVADVVAASIYTVAGTAGGTASNCNFSSSSNGASTSGNTNSTNCANYGIAGLIVQDTGASGSFNPSQLSGKPSQLLLTYIGTTIFILVVMVVLLAAAIMFFIRAVMLCLLLIVSPLGFAGMAIPQFEERAKQWQKMLIDNAIFAPIFLLLVLIGLKVMEAVRTSVGATGSTTLATALSSPGVSLGGILISFALVIGFMVAALIYARGSSAAGAQFATNFAQRTVRGFVSLPARPMQILASNTVGARSAKIRSGYNSFMSDASNGRFGGVAGRIGAGALRLTGADESINATLAKGQKVKMGTNRTYEDSQKYQKGRTDELNKINATSKRTSNFTDAIAKEKMAKTDAEKERAAEEVERAATKLKPEDFEKKRLAKASDDATNRVITGMSTSGISSLLDNEVLPTNYRNELKELRFAPYKAALEANDGEGKPKTEEQKAKEMDTIRSIGNAELGLLVKHDPDTISKLARGSTDDGDSLLTAKQKAYLIDHDSTGPTLAKAISENNRGVRFGNKIAEHKAAGDDIEKQAAIKKEIDKYGSKLTQEDAKNIKVDALTDSMTAQYLDATKLKGIMAKHTNLSDENKKKIIDNLEKFKDAPDGSADKIRYEAMKKLVNGNSASQSYWGRTLK